MADETNSVFNIDVNAIANKKTADRAVDDLVKQLLRVLKNGYIEVPAELNFKNKSASFKKAQAEFLDNWKTVADKGFFADSKKLTDKNKKSLDAFLLSFNKLAEMSKQKSINARGDDSWRKNKKGETGGIGSLRALNNIVDEFDKLGRAIADRVQEIEEQVKVSQEVIEDAEQIAENVKKKADKSTKQTNIKRKKTNRRNSKGTQYKLSNHSPQAYMALKRVKSKLQDMELQEIIDNDELMKYLIDTSGYGRNEVIALLKQNEPHRIAKKVAGGDKGGTTLFDHMEKRQLQLSNWGGGYASKMMQSQARSYAEAKKNPPPVKEHKVNSTAEWEEERKKDELQGTNKYKQDLKAYTQMAREVTLREMAKIEGGLEHNRPDVSLLDFEKYFRGVFDFNDISGDNLLKPIFGTLNMAFHRWFNTNGYIGLTNGKKTGVYEGHEQALEAVNMMMKTYEEKLQGVNGEMTETARQLKQLSKIDPRAAEKEIDKLLGRIKFNQFTNLDRVAKGSVLDRQLESLKNIREALTRPLQDTISDMNTQISTAEKTRQKIDNNILTQSVRESSREGLADETLEAIEETNANTGINSEQGKDEVIAAINDIGNRKRGRRRTDSILGQSESGEGFTPFEIKNLNLIFQPLKELINTNTDILSTTLLTISSTLNTINGRINNISTKFRKTKENTNVTKNAKTAKQTEIEEPFNKDNWIDVVLPPKKKDEVMTAPPNWKAYNKLMQKALPVGPVGLLREADRRRRKISKELTPEPSVDKAFALTTKSNKLPIEALSQGAKTLKEAIGMPANVAKEAFKQFQYDKEHSGLPALRGDVMPIASEFAETLDNLRKSMKPFLDSAKNRYSETVERDYTKKDIFRGISKEEKENIESIKAETKAREANERQIKREAELAEESNRRKGKNLSANGTPPDLEGNENTNKKQLKSFKDIMKDIFSVFRRSTKVDTIKNMSKEQIENLRAERIRYSGLSDPTRYAADTGDKIRANRIRALFNHRGLRREEAFRDVGTLDGLDMNIDNITDALQNTIQRNMFSAQTGVKSIGDIIKLSFGGIGMPSLEKSRAEADGLNEIMAFIRNTAYEILNKISAKQLDLRGMERAGDVVFDSNGKFVSGTNEAETTYKQMTDLQYALAGVLADMNAVDATSEKWGDNLHKILQNLVFYAPELQKCNTIVKNLNTGLDKNGKALKFQKRIQETLNYSFQLMTRSVGQMFKNWMMQLSPIYQIRRALQDFMSYDIKWQRTMNVIRYNLRTILRPFMEWLSQQIVNIIGFIDIISMKIQSAIGKIPISLFDQAAADSEKIYEELEAATNVSAGFDELHDIGSNNTGVMDLLGDIYKPQLSEQWRKLAEDIGDLFAGLIKGDLGFGEVMKRIFTILLDGLKVIGKWITEHWKGLLKNLLTIFLGWKLLKIAGRLLWEALFGNFTGTAIGGVFSKVGGWILKALGATAFGRGIIEGITGIFTGSGGLLTTLKSIFVGHEAITAFGAWGETLGALFAQSLIAAIGLAIGVGGIMKGFDMVADVKSYNIGLKEVGGRDKDKKSDFGGKAVGTALGGVGGALVGLAIGGPLGAAIGAGIGAIAGIITTSLAPAIEETTVKAKEMNNELLKVEQYEGRVQGVQTQVSELDELLNILNDTLKTQTNKVYEQGQQLGINKTRMDELVKATEDGTFTTSMLTGAEIGLTDGLIQLNAQQEKVRDATTKLTEAKKKLQKAELDLAIAQDIEAGNFEMAAARVEYALASEVYDTDEAVKKMTQIIKKGSGEQQTALVKDMSPDLKKKWDNYYLTTEGAMNELYRLYDDMSEKDRKTWLQNINGEIANNIQGRMNEIQKRVQNSSWWQQLLDFNKNGKILGISYIGHDIPGYATGTNYVPSDGLAYLHQGEAVIPKKYNQPYQQGMSNEERIYMQQMMTTMRSLDNTMKQGIPVSGQFTQRGSDLVAVVNKTKSQSGADVLSNVSYAR